MTLIFPLKLKVKQSEKHVIWNHEKSPDLIEGVRFHWLTTGKLERELVINRITSSLSRNGIIQTPLIPVREVVWEKDGSKMLYTLTSYDSKRFLIDEPNLGRILTRFPYKSRRDEHLVEIQPNGISIEDYVEQRYGLNPATKNRM